MNVLLIGSQNHWGLTHGNTNTTGWQAYCLINKYIKQCSATEPTRRFTYISCYSAHIYIYIFSHFKIKILVQRKMVNKF